MTKSQWMCILFCFTYSSCVVSNNCKSLSTQINKDIQTYGAKLSEQHLDWMNIPWLLKQLPNPSKHTSTDSTSYRWDCPNSDAYIKIAIDNNSKFVSIDGIVSTDQGSSLYRYPTPKIIPKVQSQAPNQADNQRSTLSPQTQALDFSFINAHEQEFFVATKDFVNSRFGANVQTDKDMMQFMIDSVATFLSLIKDCKVGNYNLPLLDANAFVGKVVTSIYKEMKLQINGYDGNNCNLIITVDNASSNCNVSRETLDSFSIPASKAKPPGLDIFLDKLRNSCT